MSQDKSVKHQYTSQREQREAKYTTDLVKKNTTTPKTTTTSLMWQTSPTNHSSIASESPLKCVAVTQEEGVNWVENKMLDNFPF